MRSIHTNLWRLEHLFRFILIVDHICDLSCQWREELGDFESKFKNLWVHFDHPEMPGTTNVLEGIIRQLSRKIDDTDGFNSPATAWNSLKLLIMNYRFKKFSCSHNGKSPLELAEIKTNKINWIRFSQKTT